MVFPGLHLFAAPMLYLDPNSGSILIQLLIAASLGIGVAVKIYWAKIKAIFRGKKAQDIQSIDENDEE